MNAITLDFGDGDSLPTVVIDHDDRFLCLGIGDSQDEISYWLSHEQANELMRMLMVALPMVKGGAT